MSDLHPTIAATLDREWRELMGEPEPEAPPKVDQAQLAAILRKHEGAVRQRRADEAAVGGGTKLPPYPGEMNDLALHRVIAWLQPGLMAESQAGHPDINAALNDPSRSLADVRGEASGALDALELAVLDDRQAAIEARRKELAGG